MIIIPNTYFYAQTTRGDDVHIVTTATQAKYLLGRGEMLACRFSSGSGLILKQAEPDDQKVDYEMIVVPRYGSSVFYGVDRADSDKFFKALFNRHSFYVMDQREVVFDDSPTLLDRVADWIVQKFLGKPK